jgi:glycine/D-amino acid oxidase-like deaminating enzyme
MSSFKNASLWLDLLDEDLTPRPQLDQNLEVDVAIMGAGYTGLWTAYYLKQQAPDLKIAIFEAQIAGYGASGRNGGWLMGELAGQDAALKDSSDSVRSQAHHLIHGIPDEVARVLDKEGIDCDFQKGGMLTIAARYPEQFTRLKEFYSELQKQGYEPEDQQWLEGKTLSDHLSIDSATAGVYTPHCASIQPAKLARGLARCVEKLGINIYEKSPVTQWKKGSLVANGFKVKANWIVPALEGYGAELNDSLHKLASVHLPVQSLIIATEPLTDELWSTMGLHKGQVFCDNSRQVTYGMRTKDNRLVFGARGGYQFAGKLRHDFDLTPNEIALRYNIMVELFPQLKDAKISHSWGGNLAMSRRFHPHMMLDKKNKFALAGGYGGEGVGATNIAGRTLADLILGTHSDLTNMPWVKPNGSIKDLKTWEPEPFTWLGYRAISDSFDREDKTLRDLNSPGWRRKLVTKVADVMESLLG